MARRIKLTTKMSVDELERRYRSASEGMERSHWQIIWRLKQGNPAYHVAKMTGSSAYWMGPIAPRLNDEGGDGLVNHRKQSRPSPHALLGTPAARDELRTALAGPAPHDDVWNSRTVAAGRSARAGRAVSSHAARHSLHRRNDTPQAPRPRHAKAASPEERATLKKSWRPRERRSRRRRSQGRRSRSGPPTNSASGEKPILRRVWAPKGKRPRLTMHPRSRWRSLSGAVHPASGRTPWHRSAGITVEIFTRSLAALAPPAGAGPDKELVLVLDRAGGHMSQRVAIPSQVPLVPLPADTPELQPAERWWAFSTTPLVNVRPADRDELDTLHLHRCAALQSVPALVATIHSATHYHWWPADYSPIT